MTTRIAQTLILTMTRGMSLSEWARTGLLEREWAIYTLLAENYDRIVVISHGDDEDERIAGSLEPVPIVITNHSRLSSAQYAASLPMRLEEKLGPIESCVIKTNQMDDAGAACSIASHLRRCGTPCALIARCGYVRSQFLAAEFGPASPQAIDASLIERTVIGSADLVVATTPKMIADLSWRDGIDAGRTRVIPNYVLDEATCDDSDCRQEGLVLCVGQLVKRKRVDRLIRAVAELRSEHDLTLEIIGEGPEAPALHALAADLQAPVAFRPRLPHTQLLARMREAAIYLHASEREGHPKSLLEAMACGMACIVADAPGVTGIIQNGVSGLLVSGEPETFAYALAGLLEDSSWREQLGACASQSVRATCSLDRIIKQERDAHRDALERAALRGAHDSAMVRWNPGLLSSSPEQIAHAWQQAFDMLVAHLPEDRQRALRSAMQDPRTRAA